MKVENEHRGILNIGNKVKGLLALFRAREHFVYKNKSYLQIISPAGSIIFTIPAYTDVKHFQCDEVVIRCWYDPFAKMKLVNIR